MQPDQAAGCRRAVAPRSAGYLRRSGRHRVPSHRQLAARRNCYTGLDQCGDPLREQRMGRHQLGTPDPEALVFLCLCGELAHVDMGVKLFARGQGQQAADRALRLAGGADPIAGVLTGA